MAAGILLSHSSLPTFQTWVQSKMPVGRSTGDPPPNAHRGRPCPVLEGPGTTSFSGCGWDWHSPLGRPALSRMAVRMLWAKLGLSVWPSPWLLQEFSLNEMEQNRRLWQEGREDRQTGGRAVGEEGARGIQVLGALCWVQCGGPLVKPCLVECPPDASLWIAPPPTWAQLITSHPLPWGPGKDKDLTRESYQPWWVCT